MHRVLLDALVMTMLALSAPHKPTCNSHTRGHLWPPDSGKKAGAAVEVCTVRTWRYRWEPVTVSYADLLRESSRKGKTGHGAASANPLPETTAASGDVGSSPE